MLSFRTSQYWQGLAWQITKLVENFVGKFSSVTVNLLSQQHKQSRSLLFPFRVIKNIRHTSHIIWLLRKSARTFL